MNIISIFLMVFGLILAGVGAIQQTKDGMGLAYAGAAMVVLGFVCGILYLCSLFERAMQASIKSAEELAQIRTKLAAIDTRLARQFAPPSPSPPSKPGTG